MVCVNAALHQHPASFELHLQVLSYLHHGKDLLLYVLLSHVRCLLLYYSSCISQKTQDFKSCSV